MSELVDRLRRGEWLYKDVLAAADEIERLSAGWQPIETAPKDGTRILYVNSFKEIGHCRYAVWPDDNYEAWWDDERDCEATPIAWMPALPDYAPPVEAKSA